MAHLHRDLSLAQEEYLSGLFSFAEDMLSGVKVPVVGAGRDLMEPVGT
jgi:hypothetical protein